MGTEADRQAAARDRARQRRRLDEIFGDVLPTIADDDPGPGRRGGFSPGHYRANRPPHHGG